MVFLLFQLVVFLLTGVSGVGGGSGRRRTVSRRRAFVFDGFDGRTGTAAQTVRSGLGGVDGSGGVRC